MFFLIWSGGHSEGWAELVEAVASNALRDSNVCVSPPWAPEARRKARKPPAFLRPLHTALTQFQAHRALAIVLLCQLPIMIVVECGVALNGFLLAEVLVLSLDAVNCSTGDLQADERLVSMG